MFHQIGRQWRAMRDAKIQSVGEILREFMRERGWLAGNPYAPLFDGWTGIVGEALSAHCTLVDVAEGALVVQVDHPGWMQMGVAAGVFALAVGGIGFLFWRRYRTSVAAAQQKVAAAVKKREEQSARSASAEAPTAKDAAPAADTADAEMNDAKGATESGNEQIDADELDRLVDEILADEERQSG